MDWKSFHPRISEPSVAILCLNVISCVCWAGLSWIVTRFSENFANFGDFFSGENFDVC